MLNPYFFSIWQTTLNYYVTRGDDNISEIVLLLSRDPLGNFFADPIGDFISRFIFHRIYKMVHWERYLRDMVKPLNYIICIYIYNYAMKCYRIVKFSLYEGTLSFFSNASSLQHISKKYCIFCCFVYFCIFLLIEEYL